MGRSPAIRVFIVLVLVFFCVALFAPKDAQLATAPVLLTKSNSTRAIAVESTSLVAEPFPVTAPIPLTADNRTRIILFAANLTLLPGETAANVTATAEDGNHIPYPLTVEYVGGTPNLSGITSVTVRLHDNLGDVGDVLVGITVHGLSSNRMRIGIGHIGGGPPDDPAAPQPTPELGSGASLHGKQIYPFDNAWNQDISISPVDPNSANLIAGMNPTANLHPAFLLHRIYDSPKLGWAVFGGALGLGMNLIKSTKAPRRASLMGGLVGGVLGGMLFDPINRFLIPATEQGEVMRFVALCAVGLSVGIFVALSERLGRDGWIRVLTGPLRGKAFILYHNPTIIGSSPTASIYLFKDSKVAPEHVALQRAGNGYELVSK
jgi:hypothetical protein